MSKTVGVSKETGTAYHSRAPMFNPVILVGFALLILLVLCCLFVCLSLFCVLCPMVACISRQSILCLCSVPCAQSLPVSLDSSFWIANSVPLVEEELLTLTEHLSSPPIFSGVRVTQSFFSCVMFCRSLFVPFVLFLLTIVLYVLLQFTDSDYLFGIF